jgi:chromosomal replication initiator protein
MTSRVEEDPNAFFRRVLDAVAKKVTRQQYETWFPRTRLRRFGDGELVVAVPNRFFQEWMTKNFREPLEQAVREVQGRPCGIAFEIVPDTPPPASAGREAPGERLGSAAPPPAPPLLLPRSDPFPVPPPPRPDARPAVVNPELHLQPHYTFENFIIGPSNRTAHAGAKAVADDPVSAHNPLFLYGAVGLGKTHLLEAICHETLRRRPDARIVYLSCEEFTNQYVSAIQRNSTEAFRARFRNVDVLLIDDIHFLANKERTAEEFFHTFNALFAGRRQIILSSDAPPSEIPTLEERLTSRFAWGLVAKLDQPEMETRMAIIRRKAELIGVAIPNDVVEFIATHVRSNIRELEGAIKSVHTRASLEGLPVDLALARAALEPRLHDDASSISLDRITEVTASVFHVKVSDLRSRKRTKTVSIPRHVVMYLARSMTSLSLSEIGDHFGGRDHTTVLYAITRVEERLTRDEAFRATIDRVRDRLQRDARTG